MATILRLTPPRSTSGDVDTLCLRLRRLEQAESPDEGTMDAISDAEQDILRALAHASANSLADIACKLAAVARRAEASDGFLTELERELLQATLRDMTRMDPAIAVA